MTGYRTNDGIGFTCQSVERALRSHQAAGLIIRWKRMVYTKDVGTRAKPLYAIDLVGVDTLELATLWETYALVCGLASARQVMEKRLKSVGIETLGNGETVTSADGRAVDLS